MLETLGLILLIIIFLGGLFLVPLGMPGTWVIVAGAVAFALLSDFSPAQSDWWVLSGIIVMALLGEALEFGIGWIGAKKLKVSQGAVVCSIIGGLLGAMVGVPVLIVGSLIGLLIGVFAGAFAYEMYVRRDWRPALQAALGAFFSRVTALFVKTMIAVAMVIWLLVEVFL